MSEPPDSGRTQARFVTGLSATLHDDGVDHAAEALDISRDGVLLRVNFPLPETDRMRVTLGTRGGDLKLVAVGQVVHALPEAGGSRLGLQFVGLDESQRRVLEDLVSRVVEGMAPEPLGQLADGAPPTEVRKVLEQIPVPHRIQLAVRATPKERERLMQDENLHVLEALVRNPKITPPEIRRLVRMVNLLPSTLDLIASDPRWAGGESLRIAVATHPRVSLSTATRLLEGLGVAALRKVLRKPGLHPELRRKLLAKIPSKDLRGW